MSTTKPDDRISSLRTKLSQALAPTYLEIIDDAAQHRGHAEEGAGHFTVRISSPLFQNKPIVECHRLVYSALGKTVGTEIHALRIDVVPLP